MLSAMQSQDFGFGLPMTLDQFAQVNIVRAKQHYVDKAAVIAIYWHMKKPPLKVLPFVQTITIGVNNDGYWMLYHIAIQLDDCVDCLKILFPDYNFLFLFGHSQGHQQKCIGSLQAAHVSLQFGSSQPLMRDTEITEGCLVLGVALSLVWSKSHWS